MAKQISTSKLNKASNSFTKVLNSGSRLSLEKKRSEIKRANTRISEVAKRYGINSDIYKETIKQFTTNEWKQFTTKTKSKDKRGNDIEFLRINMKLAKQTQNQTTLDLGRAFTQIKYTKTISSITKFAAKKTGKTIKEIQKMSDEEKGKLFSNVYSLAYSFQNILDKLYEVTDSNGDDIHEILPDLFNSKDKKRGEISNNQIEQMRKTINEYLDENVDEWVDVDEDTDSPF